VRVRANQLWAKQAPLPFYERTKKQTAVGAGIHSFTI
jgi:hypothetical protein